MSSLKYPGNTQVSYMKGIIEEKRVKWSDYAPIMVYKLPYYIKAKIGAPVSLCHSSPAIEHQGNWHETLVKYHLGIVAHAAEDGMCLKGR